jgi:hypothetical protein
MHGHGPRVAGSFSAARLLRRKRCGRVFAGPELVAGEEARPGAGGQHAQMPPRADAPLARPRPAPGGRCKQSIGNARMHEIPRWSEDSTFSLVLYSRDERPVSSQFSDGYYPDCRAISSADPTGPSKFAVNGLRRKTAKTPPKAPQGRRVQQVDQRSTSGLPKASLNFILPEDPSPPGEDRISLWRDISASSR